MEIQWRSDFDLCTILMLIMFIAVYINIKRFKSLAGTLYQFMLVDLFLATVVEYIMVYFSHIRPIASATTKCVLLTAYEVLICLLAYMFSLYVFLVARKGIYTKRRWIWNLIYTPALLTLLLIVTTQATRLVFYFEDGVFHQGPLYFGVYISVALYILFAGVIICVFRKNIIRRDRIALYVFLIFTSIGMIYQAITVGGLIGNFSSAIGMILIFFSQQSNYDTMDAGSNLYNSRAMMIHINELVNNSSPFRIVAFTPDQLISIMHNSGTLYTDAIINGIGSRLTSVYGSTNTYSLGSGRFAVITFDEWKEDVRHSINNIFAEPFVIGAEKFSLTTSGCLFQFPGDFETGDAAFELITRGLDIARDSGSNTLITIDNFDTIRDGLISRLRQEQAALQRERNEAQIAKENAESSEKAKTTFLAHMSHEIRTPLTTIMGMTEILLRDKLPDEARNNIDRIYQSSKSLLQIINDILDFSKIEAGRMEILEEPFEVAPVIESALNVLQVRVGNKPIEIVLDYDKALPRELIGDDTRIRQVLYNLCSNAAKYTDAGKITFSIKWNPGEQVVDVSVADTGKGIREADMSRLFGSFNRFDAHSNKTIEGTGLGLAITKKMVELMGGNLTVTSEYGKGSCFSFSLKHTVINPEPITDISISASHSDRKLATKIKNFVAPTARILVVDDNTFNRTIVRELIKPHQIIVEEASGGLECIEMALASTYDLIFLDHMMPGMDGFETLSILQKNKEFVERSTPVIAFSANAINGMKEKFHAAGFKEFLSKPIDVNDLENMLVAYLPKDKIEYVSERDFTSDSLSESTVPSQSNNEITIEGIDMSTGLEHVGGSYDNYFNIVRVILEDKPMMREKLIKAFDAEDIANYTIEAHALKSNMATIGAVEAAELAKSLEFAGREKRIDFIKANHEKLLEVHSEICDRLESALEQYDNRLNQQNESGADTEVLKTLSSMMPPLKDSLEAVLLLLDDCDFDTATSIVCLFARIASDERSVSVYRQISKQLALYEYEKAREIIHENIG